MTLDSLGGADRHILHRLRIRSESVQQVLDGRPPGSIEWHRTRLALIVGLLIAVAAGGLLVWSLDPMSWAPVTAVRGWFRWVKRAVARAGYGQRVLVVGAIVVLVVGAIMYRSARGGR